MAALFENEKQSLERNKVPSLVSDSLPVIIPPVASRTLTRNRVIHYLRSDVFSVGPQSRDLGTLSYPGIFSIHLLKKKALGMPWVYPATYSTCPRFAAWSQIWCSEPLDTLPSTGDDNGASTFCRRKRCG